MNPKNMDHVLEFGSAGCKDPDCELHNPAVIETDMERETAMAWALVGAWAALNLVSDAMDSGASASEALSMTYAEVKDDPQFPELLDR